MKRLEMLLAGAGAFGLLVTAGGAASATTAFPSDSCVADAAGMMTMPDGMKMPVAQMPGCSAKVTTSAAPSAAAPKSASAAPTSGAKQSAPAGAATPQKVHAGSGGQASENSGGIPVAPVGLVLAGLGVAAVAGRRLNRG